MRSRVKRTLGPLDLRFAMDTWGLAVRLAEEATTWIVADRVMKNVVKAIGTRGSVLEVGCGVTAGTYHIYVFFNFPPLPKDAIEALSDCCEGLVPVYQALKSPFSKPMVPFDDFNSARKQLQENTTILKAEARLAAEFVRLVNDDYTNIADFKTVRVSSV